MACHAPPPLLKRAAWSRIYEVDFSSFGEIVAGQTITAATVISTPVGLIVGTPALSGGHVQFRLSGGTAGADYLILVTAITSGGDTLDADVLLECCD